MSAILVLFASVEGHTARIAQSVAADLRSRGHRVDVASAQSPPDLSPYGGVIVGASVHYGHHPAWLARLLRRSFSSPGTRKTAFFSVSLGAKQKYATRFLRRARWNPELVGIFAGALKYSLYGPLKRVVVRTFAAVAGHDTDTSRDYEYTDWQAVERFSEACARLFSADPQRSPAPSSRAA